MHQIIARSLDLRCPCEDRSWRRVSEHEGKQSSGKVRKESGVIQEDSHQDVGCGAAGRGGLKRDSEEVSSSRRGAKASFSARKCRSINSAGQPTCLLLLFGLRAKRNQPVEKM